MKVIIAGSRDFIDLDLLIEKCDSILEGKNDVEIVSGAARGADRLGEHYAGLREFGIKKFPAEWNKYGKSAGYKRNSEMAEYADALIAFWDGESKGTKHMIDLADSKGLEIYVVRY
jgi:hypothetical protein